MSESLRFYFCAAAAAIPLGSLYIAPSAAQDLPSFAVVSGQTITNTGPTTINGNIALSPGTAYTGSGSVTQTGETFLTDAVAQGIQSDLTTLYNALAGRPTSAGGDLTGQDLAGMTLTAGVYNFDTSAGLSTNGTLTLDGGGDPDAIFIINVGTTLTAGSGSSIVLQNGAQGGNVFFRVGSSATLDTSADMVGQIVALTSITLNTAATVDCGAVLARNGSVTLDTNTISICTLAGVGFDPDPVDVDLTDNEQSVASALSEFVAGGGVLPASFAILAATQTGDELAATLSQLSGEVGNGVTPMVMQSMDDFLDTVMQQAGRTTLPATAAPRSATALPNDGMPIGLVREKINEVYTAKYGSAEPAIAAPALAYSPVMTAASQWNMWASGYGSQSVTDADASVGASEMTTNNRGVAAGLMYSPNSTDTFGIAISSATADFDLENGNGSGESESLFLALSARRSLESFYVEGAVAVGRSDITTDRTVTVAGADRFIGETTSDSVAAHIEAGYRMGWFTPFAGIRAQSIKTPAYSETVTSGVDTYALRYEEESARSVRSELGVALEFPADAIGLRPAFGLRAAWAHEFVSNDAGDRSFLAVPDVSFPLSSAEGVTDSLLLSASVGKSFGNGLYVDGAISTEYSDSYSDLGGSVQVGYRW